MSTYYIYIVVLNLEHNLPAKKAQTNSADPDQTASSRIEEAV